MQASGASELGFGLGRLIPRAASGTSSRDERCILQNIDYVSQFVHKTLADT